MTENRPVPTNPDPDRFREDAAVEEGQDLGRAVTQMAEEDMASAGPGTEDRGREHHAHG